MFKSSFFTIFLFFMLFPFLGFMLSGHKTPPDVGMKNVAPQGVPCCAGAGSHGIIDIIPPYPELPNDLPCQGRHA